MAVIIIYLIFVTILLIFLISFCIFYGFQVLTSLISNISGAPYVQTSDERLKTIISLVKKYKPNKIADLGSGDGKIIIALAKLGYESHGYEINPFLVWKTRINIKRAGVSKKAYVHRKNLWKVNFREYDLITLYGIPHIMERLEKKLSKELKPKTIVISNAFPFPTWKTKSTSRGMYLYIA